MKFEVILEGPLPQLERIQRTEGADGLLVEPACASPPGGDCMGTLRWEEEGEDDFNARLLWVSGVLGRLEKAGFCSLAVRTRNLAYAEPEPFDPEFRDPFRPIPGLTIQPWIGDRTPGPRERTVVLDPSHAFGSGRHPTTVLCLRLLEAILHKDPLQGHRTWPRRVLDMGCGTGLLSLAALRLGAHSALGVEIDPEAAATARRNARLNGCEGRFRVVQGSWDRILGRYHLVLANLVSSVLLRAAPLIPSHLETGGLAVVSGFGQGRSEEFQALFERHGLAASRVFRSGGWGALLLGTREEDLPPGSI